jgi:anthranilate phosphoribosyltransferase
VTTRGTDSPAGPPEFSRPPKSGDLTPALRVLLGGGTLTADQMAAAFESIMGGLAHEGEIGAFLALLATRTPTADEILGAARVMRDHVDRVPTSLDPAAIVDTAGTGGAPKTFNVSTAAAIIGAPPGGGAGRSYAIAKHGNRSRTGRGSAEVLKQLGVNVDADRQTQARCLEDAGVCFCFAIHHHPAAKFAMPVRMALSFPTIFNLLGPLTNPAGARRQLLGVYEPRFLQPIAEALAALGAVRAMVIHSDDGLDELSINAPTTVMHVHEGRVSEQRIDPKTLGLGQAKLEDLTAASLDEAATVLRGVIEGKTGGAFRDMALLNAAATLLVADAVSSIEDGLARAAESIDRGQATATLARLIELSNS